MNTLVMPQGNYSRSVAKYIRLEKARIRRTTQNEEERGKLIKDLLARLQPLKPHALT